MDSFQETVLSVAPKTLEDVMDMVNDWRAQKSERGDRMPDALWQEIILLLNKFPSSMLCTVFKISKIQLQNKQAKYQAATSPLGHEAKTKSSIPSRASLPSILHEIPPMDFCEVKRQVPRYQPERIPATNTLVVEFCRADGQLMKIHTTTDSFAELMKAFFAGT